MWTTFKELCSKDKGKAAEQVLIMCQMSQLSMSSSLPCSMFARGSAVGLVRHLLSLPRDMQNGTARWQDGVLSRPDLL